MNLQKPRSLSLRNSEIVMTSLQGTFREGRQKAMAEGLGFYLFVAHLRERMQENASSEPQGLFVGSLERV